MTFIYFLLCFIQPIILFTPEMAMITTGSLTLGALKGFIIGYSGIISGIFVMYFIGRFGREKLIQKLIKEELLIKYSQYVQKNEMLFISILFIFPIIPDNVICAGAGLSKVSFKNFIFIAAISKFFTTLAYVYLPQITNLLSLTKPNTIVGSLVGLIILYKYGYKKLIRFDAV